MTILGWDIGGVNTKVARVDGGTVLTACQEPFELQRDPDRLTAVLLDLAARIDAPSGCLHAVTMTAELSQMFRTKREGVGFVLDAVTRAFNKDAVHVYTTGNTFLAPAAARGEPLAVAAANWVATANLVAERHADTLLVDVGTTTTDIIPIVDGIVTAHGWTDPDRLATRELVYTGALRTPIEAIVDDVTVGGRRVGVSAEGFGLVGDVYVWLGQLAPHDYTTPTPDGRPVSREFSGERLARVICADRDMLNEQGISDIAVGVAGAQQTRIATALACVRQRHPNIRTACVAGLGAFIAAAAARAADLEVIDLASELGVGPARYAPAAAVGLLLHRKLAAA